MSIITTNVKPAFNYWRLIEKIIAIILLLWSIFTLYNIVSLVAGMFSSGYAGSTKTSLGGILLKDNLLIILSTLCLFGSCLLLFRDKTGWMLCVITSFAFGINLFYSSRSKAIDSKLPMAEHYKSYGVAALIFLIIFILLILKPIRKNYNPVLKTWIIISAAILFFIIDKIIIR